MNPFWGVGEKGVPTVCRILISPVNDIQNVKFPKVLSVAYIQNSTGSGGLPFREN